MAKTMVIQSGLRRLTHVKQGDSRTQESVVAAKDMKRGNIDNDAGLVSELRDDAVLPFKF